jgi:hypothetical protein
MLKKHANTVNALIGTRYDASGNPTQFNSYVVKEDRYLETENHQWWGKRNPNIIDKGGPFRVVKNDILKYNSDDFAVNFLGSLPKYGYRGCCLDSHEPAAPVQTSIDTNLGQWAPIAYSRMKPTKPSFDGVTELLELRDMVSLLKVRAEDFAKSIPRANPKDLPDAWLGASFGWLPILRSMQSFYKTYHGWEKRLKWMIEHEGRPIRARVHLESFSSMSEPVVTTGTGESGFYPALPSGTFVGSYSRKTWSQTSRLIWASAQFRFWLPDGIRDVNWTYKMKRRLFGLHFSPHQVIAAYPWTWLASWFFNAATVIRNMEAEVADRLAADYFYMMGTQIRTNVSETTARVKSSNWGPSKVVSARNETVFIEKRRLKGDPFGWNTNPNSLSGFQLSILGALGLSRLS